MLELNRVHCMDAVKGLYQLSRDVDLIVTSPPYKEKDGYERLALESVAFLCHAHSKPNALCFVNFGHLAGNKGRPFEVARMFERAGYEWVDTITWIKPQYSPVQGSRRLNNLTEFIFMFAKGKDYRLNRLSIGVPYADKSNVGRYANIDMHCGGNVWIMPYDTIQKSEQKLHPDRFPLELPKRCIKLANIPQGSVVLDPFMGSGTTARAALELGMRFIGFERNEKYCAIANSWKGKQS